MKFSVRFQVLLPCLLTLLFPLAGYHLIRLSDQQMSDFHRQSLAREAQLVARMLTERPGLLGSVAEHDSGAKTALYVGPPDTDNTRPFGRDDILEINESYEEKSLHFSLRLEESSIPGGTDESLRMHIEVTDDVVVYREIDNLSVHRNDHLRFSTLTPEGQLLRYTIAARQPGYVVAQVVNSKGRALRQENAISGNWQATDNGYRVSLKIPAKLLGSRFSFNVADVDSPETRQIRYLLGNAPTDNIELLGTLIRRSPELKIELEKLHEILSLGLRVQDLKGNEIAVVARPADASVSTSVDRTVSSKPAYIEVQETLHVAGLQVAQLVVSKTLHTQSVPLSRQFDVLLLWSLGLLAIVLLTALFIGRYLVHGLSAVEATLIEAVDPRGRIRRLPVPIRRNDEIGDLYGGATAVLQRLQAYNEYLENLARRLNHELRTPVTVISSSLEHLADRPLDDSARAYLERARNGATRLTRVLQNMSEATRLEEALDAEEVQAFDLAALVEGCVEGYQLAYPTVGFEARIEARPVNITGIPELMAQLLDKLVGNAVEFNDPGSPVRIRLTVEADHAVLRVINDGPALPPGPSARLFEAMISERPESPAEQIHLGLGLYVAGIITRFHGGELTLQDREDAPGVMARLTVPLLRVTSKLQ